MHKFTNADQFSFSIGLPPHVDVHSRYA